MTPEIRADLERRIAANPDPYKCALARATTGRPGFAEGEAFGREMFAKYGAKREVSK
jgi:hypothetical protein